MKAPGSIPDVAVLATADFLVYLKHKCVLRSQRT